MYHINIQNLNKSKKVTVTSKLLISIVFDTLNTPELVRVYDTPSGCLLRFNKIDAFFKVRVSI